MNTALAIKSCHKHADRRLAQLDTWLKGIDADFFFIIGNPTPGNGGPVINDSLACDVSDAFENIAPKVLYACEYALGANITNLFVCDDDTYVVYERLMKCGFENFDYLGFVRNYGDTPYMQGSSYWLSERSMDRIVKYKAHMRDGVPDDVAVGRCLYGEVPFTHEHRFAVGETYPETNRWPRRDNDIISCHKATQMRLIHAGVTLSGK